jgi:hypothetical protein
MENAMSRNTNRRRRLKEIGRTEITLVVPADAVESLKQLAQLLCLGLRVKCATKNKTIVF